MILNVFAEGSAGRIFVKHLQWYIHVLLLSLVMWDDVMWWGCAMWLLMSSFQPFSFTCRVGACEWAFTCFFSGIGSKVRETLRVSFGPRSDLVRTSFRTSFGPRSKNGFWRNLDIWMLGAATGLVLGAAAGAAAAAGCCSCWCYRWCYTGVFRARRFVASVPLDMTIWKEVQVLRSFFPCCKSSVPCCSMMQSHLNYDAICTSFEVGVTCVPLCLCFPIFL